MAEQSDRVLHLLLPEPLLSLVRRCAVVCVPECCGLDAFEVSSEHMESWVHEHGQGDLEEALNQLEDLMILLCHHNTEVISSPDEFNAVWRTAEECLCYLCTWYLCTWLREMLQALLQCTGPAVFDPAWLKWNGGVVSSLAQAFHQGEKFRGLPILADALEEAGCRHAALLSHCREPREHSPRCWVVELLLVGSGRSVWDSKV